MTERKSFRVIPDRRRRSVGECRKLSDVVVLIVAADEQRLLVSQVEIELENVSVKRSRCRRIESKATGVDAIADSRVIRDVTLRFVAEKIEGYRVHTWSNSVGSEVSLVYLVHIQAAEARRCTWRARRIARATRGA